MNAPETLASVHGLGSGQPHISELSRQLAALGLQPGSAAMSGSPPLMRTTVDTMGLSIRYRMGAPTPWTSGILSEPAIVEPTGIDGGAHFREILQEAQRLGGSLTQMQHAKEAEAAAASASVQQQVMLQRLAQENAQLREHCQRLEAESRVLKGQLMQGHQHRLSQSHDLRREHQEQIQLQEEARLQQHARLQEQTRLAHLARVMEAQQQQHNRGRRGSVTSPSGLFDASFDHAQQLRQQTQLQAYQALLAAHHQRAAPLHHVRGPFGHSPESTPSLSEDASDFDDDEPFQYTMQGHPMPAQSMPARFSQLFR